MTETFSILIAIGIVMIFVVICVLCSMYLIKNKIYQSNNELTINAKDVNKMLDNLKQQEQMDEYFGKLLPNEKAIDLSKEGIKNHSKEAKILREFCKTDNLDKLREEANKRYLKSRATVKISEISGVFHNTYPQYKNINVKYAIMKIVNFRANAEIKEFEYLSPIILKKVGKTFHLNIRNVLDMRQVVRFIKPSNKADRYNKQLLTIIIQIAKDLLTKKIVPEKDKYLWENNPYDMVDKW